MVARQFFFIERKYTVFPLASQLELSQSPLPIPAIQNRFIYRTRYDMAWGVLFGIF
jgi:hypothetical protein